jgi:hypothetical protein
LTESYQRLLALARREHQLALAGDVEALESLDKERRMIVAVLPEKPPAEAKPALVEMARIQAETTRVLVEQRRRIAQELGQADRKSDTARTYGIQATQPRATFSAAV